MPSSRRSIIGIVGPNANLLVGLGVGGLLGLALLLVARTLYSRRRVPRRATPFEMEREEIENARKEARRLVNAGKWAEAEACLQNALEEAGGLFEQATEFVTDVATGLVSDLFYAGNV